MYTSLNVQINLREALCVIFFTLLNLQLGKRAKIEAELKGKKKEQGEVSRKHAVIENKIKEKVLLFSDFSLIDCLC